MSCSPSQKNSSDLEDPSKNIVIDHITEVQAHSKMNNESKTEVTITLIQDEILRYSYDSGLENEDSSQFTSSSKESSNMSNKVTILNNSSDIQSEKYYDERLKANDLKDLLGDINDNNFINKTKIAFKESLIVKAENCQVKNFKIWIDESEPNAKSVPQSPTQNMQFSDLSIIPQFLQAGCEDSLKSRRLECDENSTFKSELGNTPAFKRGVLCSSTPNQLFGDNNPPAKRMKRALQKLNTIEEAGAVFGEYPEGPVKTKSLENAEKTVLQRDESSMFLELPQQRKIESLQVNKNDENNLIIKGNNDFTIAYKNLEERTIDEVILRDGDMDEEIEAMCNLDREIDREKILEKANNLKVFISNDEEENKDNFNPEWEVMKKLETDEERYKAVRKLWMNLHMPDPKEYLSSFNWRRRNSLGPPVNNLSPIHSNENPRLSTRKYYCTEVFDVAIDRLNNFYHNRRLGCKFDEAYEHAMVASLKNQPKEHMVGGRKEFFLTIDQLQSCVQERMHRNQIAKREIEAIHKFYNGLRNRGSSGDLMYLSHRERQDILYVEDIITSYSTWYRY